MKTLILILILLLSGIHLAQGQNDQKEVYLHVSVPLRSGLAAADYHYYEVTNDSLFVFHKLPFDTGNQPKLLESYALQAHQLRKLDSILSHTDSLGHHTSGLIVMGWPRFFISARHGTRSMEGFVANCYREHIFVLVDWLNEVYPDGTVIHYNKEELLERERLEEIEWKRKLKKWREEQE